MKINVHTYKDCYLVERTGLFFNKYYVLNKKENKWERTTKEDYYMCVLLREIDEKEKKEERKMSINEMQKSDAAFDIDPRVTERKEDE